VLRSLVLHRLEQRMLIAPLASMMCIAYLVPLALSRSPWTNERFACTNASERGFRARRSISLW
jgi:hypothetical protein